APVALGRERLSLGPLRDQVSVHVDRARPARRPEPQAVADSLRHRANRYGLQGTGTRRMRVSFAWNNIALAELRDLNRHRTGHRFSPLAPVGFYLPPGVSHPRQRELLERQRALATRLAAEPNGAHFYSYLLGDQVAFEHSTHADK